VIRRAEGQQDRLPQLATDLVRIAQGQEGLRLAEALDHPYSLTYACSMLAYLHIIRGELSHAVRLLERGVALSREWNLSLAVVRDTGSLGYAYALSGRIAEGIPLLEHALSASETMGLGVIQALFLVYLGEAHILADRLEDALAFAGRALTLPARAVYAAPRRAPSGSSARPPPGAILRSTLTATTVTPSRSLRSSACGPSSPTATPVSRSSTGAPDGMRKPTHTSRPPRRCTARWICGSGSKRQRRTRRSWRDVNRGREVAVKNPGPRT
jgi:hypothetical protein